MTLFRWRARVTKSYGSDTIDVELHRRWHTHTLRVTTLAVRGDDFDSRLAEAIADARQRAITLNGGIRHAARRLP